MANLCIELNYVSSPYRSVAMLRVTEMINSFVMFVILPLFFLNGDANFRRNVVQKGYLRALKMALLTNEQD